MPIVLRLRNLVGLDLLITSKHTHHLHAALHMACFDESQWPELHYLKQMKRKWLLWNPLQLLASGVMKGARISHEPMRAHRRKLYWVVLNGTPPKRTEHNRGMGHKKPVVTREVGSDPLEEAQHILKDL